MRALEHHQNVELICSTKMDYEFQELILNPYFHFIINFYHKFVFTPLESTMSAKLQEIRRKIAKLEREAEELRRLKSDCDEARKFRRMLVKEKAD